MFVVLAAFANAQPKDTLKVLMIGNSFADDCAEYIDDIAIAADRPLIVGVLYRGGCSLQRHVSYIEKNADLIQRFTNAVYKGQQWVATHTDEEVARAVAEFFPDTTVALLAASVASYRAIGAWNTDPVMTEESFGRLQTVMSEAGELTKTADFDKVVNNTFAEKVK